MALVLLLAACASQSATETPSEGDSRSPGMEVTRNLYTVQEPLAVFETILTPLDLCFITKDQSRICISSSNPKRLFSYQLGAKTLQSFPLKQNEVFRYRPFALYYDKDSDTLLVANGSYLVQVDPTYGVPLHKWKTGAIIPSLTIHQNRLVAYNLNAYKNPLLLASRPAIESEELQFVEWLQMPEKDVPLSQRMVILARFFKESDQTKRAIVEGLRRGINLSRVVSVDDSVFVIRLDGVVFLIRSESLVQVASLADLIGKKPQEVSVQDVDRSETGFFVLLATNIEDRHLVFFSPKEKKVEASQIRLKRGVTIEKILALDDASLFGLAYLKDEDQYAGVILTKEVQ